MIQANTFSFLKNIAVNNNREWFQANKAYYEEARENALEFTSSIIRLLSKVDSSINPELEAKACLMRIYRDIRFSKDKIPYKTNFGIGISANGKNFNGPG